MGIYWTEFGTDGEDDVQSAWHCPVGDGKQLKLVKGGLEFEDRKTGEKEFIDLTPDYELNSFSAYGKFSKSIEKYASGYILNTAYLTEDYIIGDVRRFEERLDIMGFRHFDGISALKEEAKKRYEPYFTEPVVKVKYTMGLKNYLEEFHPNTKVHEIEKYKTWVLINKDLTIDEAFEWGNKIDRLSKGKIVKTEKRGDYATAPMEINDKVIKVKIERYRVNSFIYDCGLKGYRFTQKFDVSYDFSRYLKNRRGKLFRLDHYYDLFEDIMEKLFDRHTVTLAEDDKFKKLQEFDYEHRPNLEYIRDTDTQKIN